MESDDYLNYDGLAGDIVIGNGDVLENGDVTNDGLDGNVFVENGEESQNGDVSNDGLDGDEVIGNGVATPDGSNPGDDMMNVLEDTDHSVDQDVGSWKCLDGLYSIHNTYPESFPIMLQNAFPESFPVMLDNATMKNKLDESLENENVLKLENCNSCVEF